MAAMKTGERYFVRVDSRCSERRPDAATLEAHLAYVRRLAGETFNINSPKQLGEVLFTRLELPVQATGKTGPSTDRTVLAKLRPLHPIIAVIERWRDEKRTVVAVLHDLDQVRRDFPSSLLLKDTANRTLFQVFSAGAGFGIPELRAEIAGLL